VTRLVWNILSSRKFRRIQMPGFIILPTDCRDIPPNILPSLSRLRSEEVACLDAIYSPDITITSSLSQDSPVTIRLSCDPFELVLRCSVWYPLQAPIVEVSVPNGAMTKLQLFELETNIRGLIPVEDQRVAEDIEATLAGILCEVAMDFAAEVRGDDGPVHDINCECADCIPSYASRCPFLTSMNS